MLRVAGALTLAAMLDRVGRDLTAVVRVLVAVTMVVRAAHDLTRALATHGLCVRQHAALSSSLVDLPIAVVVATIASFEARIPRARSIAAAVDAGVW